MHFDQCRFNLRPPGHRWNEFTRKRTTLWTNIAELREMEGFCRGQSCRHRHVHAWGVRKVGKKSIKLATAAGQYPFDMCDMVSWLSPVVRIDRELLQGVPLDLEQPFPELAGWSISEETRQRISIRSFHACICGIWGRA